MLDRASLLKDKLNFLKEHDPTNKEIEQLEKSLKYSKRGKSAKAKGANYERKIAKVFENSHSVSRLMSLISEYIFLILEKFLNIKIFKFV